MKKALVLVIHALIIYRLYYWNALRGTDTEDNSEASAAAENSIRDYESEQADLPT